MNLRAKLLEQFRTGKTPADLRDSGLGSSSSIYKYYRLYLLTAIRDKCQHLVDAEDFELLPVPEAKKILNLIENW